ncbi:MAG TPA: ADP-ribosylglycohydrolase family protein [Candidatus Acidoferrum sp.]
MLQRLSRFQGALLGLASGDALGTTLEFCSPGSFQNIDDMVGGGPFSLKPGDWTDDTSMALCLAESLLESNGFDPVDQLQRYTKWYKSGHLSSDGRVFDIGNTVRSALAHFAHSGNGFSGPTDEYSAGNGSLMRLAPVPLFYAATPEMALHLSGESSRTTHGAKAAIDACTYMGGLIAGALRGDTKEALLSENYSPVADYFRANPLGESISEIAAGSFKRREPPQICGSGYVVKSLEAALWAFHRSQNFREGCLLAVNLGDDADTTGAIYGQLAGAFYGVEAIPLSWQRKLAKRELIESFAERLMFAAAKP